MRLFLLPFSAADGDGFAERFRSRSCDRVGLIQVEEQDAVAVDLWLEEADRFRRQDLVMAEEGDGSDLAATASSAVGTAKPEGVFLPGLRGLDSDNSVPRVIHQCDGVRRAEFFKHGSIQKDLSVRPDGHMLLPAAVVYRPVFVNFKFQFHFSADTRYAVYAMVLHLCKSRNTNCTNSDECCKYYFDVPAFFKDVFSQKLPKITAAELLTLTNRTTGMFKDAPRITRPEFRETEAKKRMTVGLKRVTRYAKRET